MADQILICHANGVQIKTQLARSDGFRAVRMVVTRRTFVCAFGTWLAAPSFLDAAKAQPGNPIADGLRRAQELWSQRGHQEPELQNVRDCISVVMNLLNSSNPGPTDLYLMLEALSGSYAFLGNVTEAADDFENGAKFGERILTDVFHLTPPLSDLHVMAPKLKQDLSADQLTGCGTGLFLAAANWLGWS